jgi:hypothetical protein
MSDSVRPNPYVGPRPFRRDEPFFGRERDGKSLVNSLLAGRVLLLHSPSGAGKTSLIQTSVAPSFEERGFLLCASFDPVFDALRVNLPPPPELPVANRYVFSVVNALIGNDVDRHLACRMTLSEAFDAYLELHGPSRRQLIVLDQLEEVLTTDPGDIGAQCEFFRQLGDALNDARRWALLAIREDYMGALDRFREYLPGQLRATFRLDLLSEEAALRAVIKPAGERNVTFDEAAAGILVKELALAHSGVAGEQQPNVRYPHVEPVLLQVVCYSLFRKLAKSRKGDFDSISARDVEDFQPFGKAIAKYYRGVVRDAADGDLAVERALRDWVESHLVSKRHLRRQTRQKPTLPDGRDPAAQLGAMQSRYLIRDDPRPGGAPLWELTHDMLVNPVLEDNRVWRKEHLERWQNLAEEWEAAGRDRQYLLRGVDYYSAPPPGRRATLTEKERDYLDASDKELADEGKLTMLQRGLSQLQVRLRLYTSLLVVSLLANVVLGFWLILTIT